jgi:hypothetical protein
VVAPSIPLLKQNVLALYVPKVAQPLLERLQPRTVTEVVKVREQSYAENLLAVCRQPSWLS